jgi:hypothetical protein
MASLFMVPTEAPRPTHLIRVAVPRLNKCDRIEEYLKQIEARDYDLEWAQVDETKVLSCAEWNDVMRGFLTDREWLAGKGGTSSWSFEDSEDLEFFKLTEEQRAQWKRTAYIHVVAIQCGGQTIYIDPQGYNYARYVAFPADGMPEGMTREQRAIERAKAEQAKRDAELAARIANPPTVPADHGLRFLWNGIKHNGGNLVKCHYSIGTLTKYPEGTITIYARDHRFPAEMTRYFHVENNTDIQSDYFDDDKMRVCPNHPLHADIKTAFEAQEAHHSKRLQKRMERKGY